MNNSYDVIVIGLGAMGSAATYQLAKRRKRVLGIDQFTPPHRQGSSHGDTRITRQAIGEGEEYVSLVLRSYELWNEIEKASGKQVLKITGGLIMTSAELSMHHRSNFFNQTVASAKKFNIVHTLLDAKEIGKRFPQFKLAGNEKGYFEEMAGYLRPELCIEAQLALAQRHGAELVLNEKAFNFIASGSNDKVTVQTDKGEYLSAKAIITAGSWAPSLLDEELAKYFNVYRQVLYWFDIDSSISQFESPNFPVWIWEFGMNEDDFIYGFPAIDDREGGVKLASEQYTISTNPNDASREVTEQEIQAMYQRYVQPHINGLSNKCIKAAACLYTVTPDHKFVIDAHPVFPQVIVASPCSGHGFKHSAAVGEVLTELAVEGKSTIDISKFSFSRFSSI